jgi:monoamine oxidase
VTPSIDADVCVVGGGFAGLTSASRLAKEGISCVVVEARERVGGRTWTEHRPNGISVDRGGAWLGHGHSSALALARELGVDTYRTNVAGSHLLVGDEGVRRYKGLIPKISPLAVLQIAAAQWRIDRMAGKVPLEAPWNARNAAQWDAEPLGPWLERGRIRSKLGRDLFEMAVRGLFAAPDPSDVSLLNLLFLVRAHGKIERLFSIEGGAQENLVDGGLGGLCVRLAARLGDSVRLAAPVRRIAHGGDRVTVSAEGLSVSARFAVVAVPPALALEIDFDPPLEADRRTLYAHAVAGVETKSLIVFERPFWRDDGFSGQSAEPGSAAEVTIDSSPVDGANGVLASFTFGSVAAGLDALPTDQRRGAVLDSLARRFGPRASSPIDFIETPWWKERWSRGCSMAHFAPGTLTQYGHLLRAPRGRIHWAGTETSTQGHGAVEGAIRSGERAAHEVLDRLSHELTTAAS